MDRAVGHSSTRSRNRDSESMSKQITGGFTYENDGDGREVRYGRDDGEPPSVAVATALATYHGDDVTTTSTRLYDHVDPEALDALFADRYDGGGRRAGKVTFDVGDATVVVRPESVRVYPGEP